jgi:hypothetical protein
LSPEHDAKLRADYPRIFTTDTDRRVRRLQGQLAAPFPHRGFECGEGWYDLITGLCRMLQMMTEDGAPQVVAVQVKEKFGMLRFSSLGQDERQEEIIEVAEVHSSRLCEVCGNPGQTVQDQWIRTRCFRHMAR